MAKSDFDDEMAGAAFEDNQDGLLIDLGGVEAQTFENLPKGIYGVIIEENEYKLSESSGKPMWNVKLAVTDEEYQNRKIFTFLSFSEKALPGTKSALAVIAPELLSQPFNPKDPEIVQSIVGRAFKVKLTIRKGTDGYDDSNNVQRWYPADDASGFSG